MGHLGGVGYQTPPPKTNKETRVITFVFTLEQRLLPWRSQQRPGFLSVFLPLAVVGF